MPWMQYNTWYEHSASQLCATDPLGTGMQVENCATSGAMYAGVPTVDLGCESKTADLEYPKSQIFKRGAGRPSRRVFSSFRSLWHTPCKACNKCIRGHRVQLKVLSLLLSFLYRDLLQDAALVRRFNLVHFQSQALQQSCRWASKGALIVPGSRSCRMPHVLAESSRLLLRLGAFANGTAYIDQRRKGMMAKPGCGRTPRRR